MSNEDKEKEDWLLTWLAIWIAKGGKTGAEETRAYQEMKSLIQQRPKIDDEPGGLKPGEYMHEWIEKDAVNFDLPTEEIIEALCRDNRLLKKKLDQKPEIDDMKKYVEKKASEIHFYIGLKEGISLDICEELVSQIIGDARGGGKKLKIDKAYVDEKALELDDLVDRKFMAVLGIDDRIKILKRFLYKTINYVRWKK